MPAYNAARYISESIESIINQTYRYWELLVVDDGSTDDTKEIVKQYTRADARIQYLYQQNGRQGKARNLGIKKSSGKYIAFLDADDKWTNNKLSVQTEIISSNHNIDLVFSQGFYLTENKETDFNVRVQEYWDNDDLELFIQQNQIPILSVIVKRQVLEKVNFFSEAVSIKNAEDYHLWLKLLIDRNTFRSIPDRLFYYRVHPAQSTFQNKNLRLPTFNVYEDLFYQYPHKTLRKLVVGRLSWLIYDNDFHGRCVNVFSTHFEQKRNIIFYFLIKKFLNKPDLFRRRILFKIISIFG